MKVLQVILNRSVLHFGGFVLWIALVLTSNIAYASPEAEAGFSELEPIEFSFQLEGPTLSYTSSRVRVFYSFQPADENPAWKPLFVFFNGGPGCATSDGLLSTNTAPFTPYIERTYPDRDLVANSDSWTRLGNLLYIDAPNTGFSYNLIQDETESENTIKEFDVQNFNPYIDAAQMVRVMLRFLSTHPEIGRNPVILVGESYGGTRTTLMLDMLLNYRRYGNGSDVYRDSTLVREVQAYFDRYFMVPPWHRYLLFHPPEQIARQFGHHILIEPQLTGRYQTAIAGLMFEQQNSVIYQIAAATGKTFTPCAEPGCDPASNAIDFVMSEAERDPYDYEKEVIWEFVATFWALARLVDVPTLSTLVDYSVENIEAFYASNRKGAYRLRVPSDETALSVLLASPALDRSPPAERAMLKNMGNLQQLAWEKYQEYTQTSSLDGPDLIDVFGELSDKDEYLMDCNLSIYDAFYWNSAIAAGYDIDPESERYGRIFLQNLPLLKVLITDARRDLMVYSPSIPPSFEFYSDLVRKSSVLRPCPTCDAVIQIEYHPEAMAKQRLPWRKSRRSIWFPLYQQAGHSVSSSMPDKLIKDVEGWLQDPRPPR